MIPSEIAALVPWHRILEEIGADPGRHGRTCCTVHKGDNPTAFSYKEILGKAYCFGCGWHGDKLEFLWTTLGLDFKTTLSLLASMAGVQLSNYRKPNGSELARAKAHRMALAAAKQVYEDWQWAKLTSFTDEYREVVDELEVAEIGYRAAHRCHALYSEDNRLHWTKRLASLYDRITALEYQLDLLTFTKWEAERFSWWQEEVESGQLAA